MIQSEHHYQRVDLENCYIEATRDDTADIQDCHYSVWKNGRKIHEGWVTYNIQYDYIRHREWWHGKLYYDYLESDKTYGHLAEEFSHMPPEKKGDYCRIFVPEDRFKECIRRHFEKNYHDWEPYPNNWEPVTPRGSDYFRQHGICGASSIVLECGVSFGICFYIPNDLREIPMSLIDCVVEPLTPDDLKQVEYTKKIYEKHTSEEWKEWRLEFLREHSKEIGVEIPYDPRFID